MSPEKIQKIQESLRELLPLITIEAIKTLPTFRAFEPTYNKLLVALYDAYIALGDERAKQLADLIWYWGQHWFTHNEDQPQASIDLINQFIDELETKKLQENPTP